MFLDHADRYVVAHTNNGPGDAMGGNVQPRRNAAGKVSGHVPSVGPILHFSLFFQLNHARPSIRFNHPLCSNARSPCALTPHRRAIMWRHGPFLKPYF